VRHDLPRWERHLRRRGITVVPGPQAHWSDEEDRSHSELFLLMMQAGHGVDGWTEHRQRDITNVRPLKLLIRTLGDFTEDPDPEIG